RQPLPADAGLELDHPPVVRTLNAAPARRGRRRGAGLGRLRALDASARRRAAELEDLVEREPELADDRVERANRGLDLSGLDLRDEARRDLEAACELAQAQAEPVAFLA